ncbi:MAG: ribosome assembly RNA-binding protein YhbY [Lachnospiraceae bacterium]|nr:ribosome assembly RNA-binding protein YhbY [Lachnospiraceae bacterium]
MTSKERAYLRSQAMTMEPILHIGKASVTPELTEAVSEALEARELIKLNVLQNCTDDVHYIADAIAGRTRADVVQVIGKKIVLYRPHKDPEKRRYQMPR